MTAVAPELDLTVTDVRQYLFCPRTLYFRLIQPVTHRLSYKMDEGVRMHERAGELERRRTLREFQLPDGERRFGVELFSQRLGVTGKLDMLIERQFETIPVEFKHSRAGGRVNHRYQLTLYGLLLEEASGRTVRRGFLLYLVDNTVEAVVITEGMRRYVTRTLRVMRDLAASEGMPEGTRQLGKCVQCEYLHFCHDRW